MTQEEIERIKRDFSLAYYDKWNYYGRQEESLNHQVLAELKDAIQEFDSGEEKKYHIEWNIVDVDECHIYVTNKTNGHRYHLSVICPAALYVDVYRIQGDGSQGVRPKITNCRYGTDET